MVFRKCRDPSHLYNNNIIVTLKMIACVITAASENGIYIHILRIRLDTAAAVWLAGGGG